MTKTGKIEINITGSKGNEKLSLTKYDIREIKEMLENVENLLFPKGKRDRPTISYRIEEGSIKHVFITTVQTIIGFNALLGRIHQNPDLDILDPKTAEAFENIHQAAIRNDYEFNIKTSLEDSHQLTIKKETRFTKTEPIWADAEFYLYGKITNAGGKDKANIHISTEEMGTLLIKTPKSFLEQYRENILYKEAGIRASGKQDLISGDLDTSSFQFVELIEYEPTYDKEYLSGLRKKAKWVKSIDPDAWLAEIRGRDEA